MVQQYNIKNVGFTVQKRRRKRVLLSPCLIKYIHLHFFFYTSVVDTFVAPVQKHKVDSDFSSHLCFKDVSVWKDHQLESRELNIKLDGYFTVESVLIVLRQSKNKQTKTWEGGN